MKPSDHKASVPHVIKLNHWKLQLKKKNMKIYSRVPLRVSLIRKGGREMSSALVVEKCLAEKCRLCRESLLLTFGTLFLLFDSYFRKEKSSHLEALSPQKGEIRFCFQVLQRKCWFPLVHFTPPPQATWSSCLSPIPSHKWLN